MASAQMGQVIECHTVNDFKAQMQMGIQSKKLVVVEFTAPSCGPCRNMAPIMGEIAKKMSHAMILKVDVDELKTVAEEYKVDAMPTFLLLKDGKEVDRLVGAKKEELHSKITTFSVSV